VLSRIKELYEYRDLLVTMAMKELKLQYRNSVLGFFWSLLNPLLMMLIFTFVFANVFKFNIKDFPIFILCGLFPWNFFNGSLVGATGSIVANSNLIKKVYFPREILPLASVLANLINFLLSIVVLFLFLIVYGHNFYVFIPLLLVIIFIETILIAGAALLLSSLNVYYRDIQYIVGVGLLAIFYATPVIYQLSMVEKSSLMMRRPYLMYIYKLNPMVWMITVYRELLYENRWPTLKMFLYAITGAVILLIIGYTVFHRLQPRFAEEV